MAYTQISIVGPIDFTDEELDIGDRLEFLTKMNSQMVKLQAWTTVFATAVDSINSHGQELEASQIDDLAAIQLLQSQFDALLQAGNIDGADLIALGATLQGLLDQLALTPEINAIAGLRAELDALATPELEFEYPESYYISGPDWQPAIMLAAQASYVSGKPLVLSGDYSVATPVVFTGSSTPATVVSRRARLIASVSMSEVLLVSNIHGGMVYSGRTVWHGSISCDANSLATYGLRIKGTQFLTASFDAMNAQSHGVYLESLENFGIYDCDLTIVTTQNGGNGFHAETTDETRRNNGCHYNVSAKWNRGYGVFAGYVQATWYIVSEKNTLAGMAVEQCWANIIDGYTEQNGNGGFATPYGDTNWVITPGLTIQDGITFHIGQNGYGVTIQGRHLGNITSYNDIPPYDFKMEAYQKFQTDRFHNEPDWDYSYAAQGFYGIGQIVWDNGQRYVLQSTESAEQAQYLSGNRAGLIVVTGSANISEFGTSTLQNLVNGQYSLDESGAWAMSSSGVAAAGEWIDFEFVGDLPVIGDAFFTSVATLGGLWKAQISINSGASYTDVTTEQAENNWMFSTNATPITNFRLLGVSGTMGFNYVPEIEFLAGAFTIVLGDTRPRNGDGSSASEWVLLDGVPVIDGAGVAATAVAVNALLPALTGPFSLPGRKLVLRDITSTEGQVSSATFETVYTSVGGVERASWLWVSGRVLA